MLARKLNLAVCTAVLAVAAFPAAAGADTNTTVCNEAENSPRGGYVVTDGPVDPNPPAFLRGSQMRVGKGAGLVGAAERSPALRLCGPEGTVPTDPTDTTDPTDPIDTTDPTDPIDTTDPTDPGEGGGPIQVA